MAKPPEKMMRNAGAGAVHRVAILALLILSIGMLLIIAAEAVGLLVPR